MRFDLAWYVLIWHGIYFVLAQKFAPVLFWLLRIPRPFWRNYDHDEALPPEFDGWRGLVRYFFVRQFTCSFCIGAHAGWIGYLLVQHVPIATFIFAGATVCYILESALPSR